MYAQCSFALVYDVSAYSRIQETKRTNIEQTREEDVIIINSSLNFFIK